MLALAAHAPQLEAHWADAGEPVAIIQQAAVTSFDAAHTALIRLSPAFMEALRQIGPKRRHSKIPYVLAAALFLVLGVLGTDRPTRLFLAEKGSALLQAHLNRGASITRNETAPPATATAPTTPSPSPADTLAVTAAAAPVLQQTIVGALASTPSATDDARRREARRKSKPRTPAGRREARPPQ